MPSPALMIADRQMRASSSGAPDEAWRMTIMSGDIASRLRTVSTSVSPLVTLDVEVAMLKVSALRRFSAISKDVRVLVLGSKNKFTTVRPRSVGTFLIERPPISFIASAVSRMSVISSASRPAMPSRCRDFSAARRRGKAIRHTVNAVGAIGDSRGHGSPSMTISSVPSISWRRTCTLCLSDVGRFLPT